MLLLLCGFRVRRGVCGVILSVAAIGLSRHLMNLMRIISLDHESTINVPLIDRLLS